MRHAARTRFARANDTWRCATADGWDMAADGRTSECLVETCVDKQDKTPHALPPDSLGTPALYSIDAAGTAIAQVQSEIMRERLRALAAKQALTARCCYAPVPDANLSGSLWGWQAATISNLSHQIRQFVSGIPDLNIRYDFDMCH